MVSVARENLLQSKLRFAMTISGVALSIMLISFQIAILIGTLKQITTYIDHTKANLWITQKGVEDIAYPSLVSKAITNKIKNYEGISKYTGVYIYYATFKVNKNKVFGYMVGYDTKTGFGGPWKLGKRAKNFISSKQLKKHQIIVEEVIAQRNNLKISDSITLFGQKFKIVAFSKETNSLASQYVFVPREDAEKLIPGGTQTYTHYLLQTKKGFKNKTMDFINSIKGVNAVTKEKMRQNTIDYMGMFLVPLLSGGVFIGFLVGLIIIGLTIYNATVEKIKEFGIIKAIGANNSFVNLIVIKQSLFVGIVGYIIGLALSYIVNATINNYVPGLDASLDLNAQIAIFVLAIAMSLVASLLPVRKLKKVDPVEVFRS